MLPAYGKEKDAHPSWKAQMVLKEFLRTQAHVQKKLHHV